MKPLIIINYYYNYTANIKNMSNPKPILIGSRALATYDIVEEKDCLDIDLIVNDEIFKDLCVRCDKKKGQMLFFEKIKIDVNLLKNESDDILFNELNKTEATGCKIINLENIGEVIIPPLEILYVIIKSHIHRIVPVTPYQNQNIEVWYKHVDFYKKIRDRLGYKKLDKILYEQYLGDWKKITNDGSLHDLMRIIYQLRFNETNIRVGDTLVSMEKSEEEFFNDNVERFIDHDKIHQEIGIMFREDAKPLFTKYQTDQNKVNLDLTVFLKANNNERITMIMEEIMVLLMERKWIPEIMKCYKDLSIPYIGYDKKRKEDELRDIGSNYVTNLCGQGDYWLRRFCIDHVHILLDPKKYDFDKMKTLTLKLTNYESKCEKFNKTKFIDDINEYDGDNEEYLEHYFEIIKKNNNKENKETVSFFGNNEKINIPFLNIDNSNTDMTTLSIGDNVDKNIESLFSSYFKDEFNIGCNINNDSFTIYNMNKNVGVFYSIGKIKVFTINICKDDSKKDEVTIDGSYVDYLSNTAEQFENNYSRKYKTYYYRSSSCEFNSEIKKPTQYISSYGTAPDFMSELLQLIAEECVGEYELDLPYGIKLCVSDEDDIERSDSSDYSSDTHNLIP
jgi:hypothetical protein